MPQDVLHLDPRQGPVPGLPDKELPGILLEALNDIADARGGKNLGRLHRVMEFAAASSLLEENLSAVLPEGIFCMVCQREIRIPSDYAGLVHQELGFAGEAIRESTQGISTVIMAPWLARLLDLNSDGAYPELTYPAEEGS